MFQAFDTKPCTFRRDSTAGGSTGGGLMLTVSGRGFVAGATEVEAPAGVPCAVRSVTATAVVCETKEVPAPPTSSPPLNATAKASSARAMYAGGRGVRRESWFNSYHGRDFNSAIEGPPDASYTTRLESFHGGVHVVASTTPSCQTVADKASRGFPILIGIFTT